jgi:hypothetical protein
MPTPVVPAGQEGGFVRVQEAAAAAMARLALGERGALQIPRHGAPTEPHLLGHGLQGPALPMGGPDLLVDRHPLRPPRGTKGCCPGGGLWGREWHGGKARGGGR